MASRSARRPAGASVGAVRWSVVVWAFVGLVLSLVFFDALRRRDRAVFESEFTHRAHERIASIEREVEHTLVALQTAAALFEAPHVSREHFRSFVERSLKEYRHLTALSWNPVVANDTREAHEQATRAEGRIPGTPHGELLRRYTVRELSKSNGLVPAGTREEHVVVHFIEPLGENAAALGLDVLAEPRRRAAIDLARATGRPTATEPIRLIQDRDGELGILIFSPVPPAPLLAGGLRGELRGFVVAAVRIRDLVDAAFAQLRPTGIDVALYDRGPKRVAADAERLLYFHRSRLRSGPAVDVEVQSASADHESDLVHVAGREWMIRCTPTGTYRASAVTWVPVGALGCCLLVTVLVIAHFYRLSEVNRQLLRRVAEREEAREKLQASKAQLARLIDSLPELVRISGTDKLCIRFNKSWTDFTGKSVESELGDGWAEGVHPEDLERCLDVYTSSFDARTPFQMEYRLRRRDGAYRWVLDSGRPWYKPDGEFLGYISSCVDVTDRIEAEKALHQQTELVLMHREREKKLVEAELERTREELIQSTRLAAIGQMAAQIAHDLRNPLGAVRNAAYYMKRKTPEGEMWPRYLNLIEEEVDRCNRIIGDLLEATRGKEPIKQRVDLGQAVSDALQRLDIPEGVRVRLALNPDPFTVLADPTQLGQVLDNLLKNSVDAVHGTGEIRVDAQRDADCDRIVVRDTGEGVSDARKESIFNLLFTTKAKGTGLGLFICRQIVERHRGTIELLDTSEGAAFNIKLPPAADATERKHGYQESSARSHR